MAKNNFFLKIKVSRTGILTALIFLFFAGTSADTFAQAWFNNSWSYRKSHVINLAAGAGTNYQVQVTVNFGSGPMPVEVCFVIVFARPILLT